MKTPSAALFDCSHNVSVQDLVKEGATLAIVIASRHDDSDGGYVKSVTTAVGHKF